MKKIRFAALGVAIGVMVSLTGCVKDLSNEYVTVSDYKNIEVDKVKVEKASKEDVDRVLQKMLDDYMESGATTETNLTPDKMTDDMIQTMTGTKTTVETYRKELEEKINNTYKENARAELEKNVWAAIIDKSKVKKYPKEQIELVTKRYIDQYEQMAEDSNMTYEEYLKAVGEDLETWDEDLEKAAKAAVKQQLVAEVIAKQENLKPTDEDYDKAVEEYAKEYQFTNVEELKAIITEEELQMLVIEDNVKAWLADHCKQK